MFEISSVLLIQKNQIDPILDTQSVMNVVIWWSKLNTVHVHSDRNNFTFVRTAIHNFIFYQSICFCGSFSTSSKSLLSDKADFHAFYFYFYEIKTDFSDNDIFQMIKLFVPFKLNVKTIFNTDLHLHWSNLCFLNLIVRNENCKVNLLG